MNQQVATRASSDPAYRFAVMLNDQVTQKRLKMFLPANVDPSRLCTIAMEAVRQNPDLLKCDPVSFVEAVKDCALTNLMPDGVSGEAYFVPYKGRVQFQPGYLGLIKLIRNTGLIGKVAARAVRAGDFFEHEFGLNERLVHRPLSDDKRDITHVYAIAWWLDSDISPSFEVMTAAQVEEIRQAAPGKNSDAWRLHWEPMAKKTVMRRLTKFLPKAAQVHTVVGMDEAFEATGKVYHLHESGGHAVLDEGDTPKLEEKKPAPRQVGSARSSARLEELAEKTGQAPAKVEETATQKKDRQQAEAAQERVQRQDEAVKSGGLDDDVLRVEQKNGKPDYAGWVHAFEARVALVDNSDALDRFVKANDPTLQAIKLLKEEVYDRMQAKVNDRAAAFGQNLI